MQAASSKSSSSHNQIHIIHPGSNVDRNELLQQFTQWDTYLTSSHGENTPVISSQQHFTTGYQPLSRQTPSPSNSIHNSKGIKRFPSIKSKDFTSNKELNSTKRKGVSIFHKGFLQRSKLKINRTKLRQRIPSGPKFRNQNEFNSCLNYIDLNSMANDQYSTANSHSLSHDIEDILFQSNNNNSDRKGPFYTSQNVILYKPQNNNTNIVVNKVIPRDIYFNQNKINNKINNRLNHPLTKRHNTIKRKLSKRDHSVKRNKHRTLNIKRSNTLPANVHSTPQSNDITTVWSKYLQAVIAQRIALRLTLMNSQPASSSSSSSILNCSTSNHSSIPSTSTQDIIKIH